MAIAGFGIIIIRNYWLKLQIRMQRTTSSKALNIGNWFLLS
jgi:hypothetical protein